MSEEQIPERNDAERVPFRSKQATALDMALKSREDDIWQWLDNNVCWLDVPRLRANYEESRDRKADAYMPASELLRWLKLAVQRMQDAGIEFNHVNFQHVIGRAERALAAKETS